MYFRFIFFVSFLISFFANAQNSYLKVIGKNSGDIFYDMDQTTDGGIIFGGVYNSEYYLTRCNSFADTIWTKKTLDSTNIGLYKMCSLKDGRFAICGTDYNQGYEQVGLVVTDSLGAAPQVSYFTSSAWGVYDRDVYAMPDSGLLLTAYEDGYTCSNTMNIYRLDKGLNSVWDYYVGTCDADVLYSEGFSEDNLRMHMLRMHYMYYDTSGNFLNDVPEVITIDTSHSVVFDSVYVMEKNFNGIIDISSGGVLLFGRQDTLGSQHICLMKISANGTIQWTTNLGSVYDEFPVNVVETNDHGFAILSTQTIPGSNTGVDLSFYKIDVSGQLQFSRTYGSTGNETAVRMIKKKGGSLLILGRTNGFGNKVNMVIQLDSLGQLNTNYQINSISNHYCIGDTAILSVSPGAASYLWSSGDTTSTIRVTTTGNYELTVIDSAGYPHIVPFFAVYFDNPPNAVISGGPLTICDGQSVQLSVPSGTGNFYQWFKDGTLIDTANFRIYRAGISGNYFAVVSNACGIDTSLTVSLNAYSNPPIPQVTTFPSNHVCVTTPVYLTTNNFSDSINWGWSGNQASGDTLFLSNPGRYFIAVTATNSFGCVSPQQSVQVIIDGFPQIDLTDSSKNICIPGSTLLPYSYSASFGTFTYMLNGNVTNSSTYPYNFYAYNSGLYSVKMTNFCGADSDSVVVIANFKPVIDFFPDTPTMCSGQPVLLTCLTGGEYKWIKVWGNTVVSTDSVFSATIPGYYYLEVTDTNTNCTSSTDINILTSQDTALSLLPLMDTLLCPGGQVTFDPGTFDFYLWSTGDNSSILTLTNTGFVDTVNYSITVVDSMNCASADTFTVIFDLCNVVQESPENYTLSVYPNPSSGTMTFEILEISISENAEFSLVDFSGKVVFKSEFKGEVINVDTKDFACGHYFYLVKLKAANLKGVVEFVK